LCRLFAEPVCEKYPEKQAIMKNVLYHSSLEKRKDYSKAV